MALVETPDSNTSASICAVLSAAPASGASRPSRTARSRTCSGSMPRPSSLTSSSTLSPSRGSTSIASRARSGLCARRRSAGVSMPWSIALRSRCTSGSRICSRMRRSISIAAPSIRSSTCLPLSRARSRTRRGAISSSVENGSIRVRFMSSSRWSTMPASARRSCQALRSICTKRSLTVLASSASRSTASSSRSSGGPLRVAPAAPAAPWRRSPARPIARASPTVRLQCLRQPSSSPCSARRSAAMCSALNLKASSSSACNSSAVSLAVEMRTVCSGSGAAACMDGTPLAAVGGAAAADSGGARVAGAAAVVATGGADQPCCASCKACSSPPSSY